LPVKKKLGTLPPIASTTSSSLAKTRTSFGLDYYNDAAREIIAFMSDGGWHCQAEFRLVSKSLRKRRGEIEQRGSVFEERQCTHGIVNSKDFRFAATPPPKKPKYAYVERNGVIVQVAL
jgi:hypothetical protein